MKIVNVLAIAGVILISNEFGVFNMLKAQNSNEPKILVSSNVEKQVQQIDSLSEEEIKEILSKEFTLLEETKNLENKEKRLQTVRTFVNEENKKLKLRNVITFGEYDTYVVNTYTIDGKNTKTMGATFNIAYGIDLVNSYYSFDEIENTLILNIPKDDVILAHCMKGNDTEELADDKSFLNAIYMPWEVAKREELKEEAIRELETVATAKAHKSFEELESMATLVAKDIVFGSLEFLKEMDIFDINTKINWI